ncbi:MAG: Lipoprotein-releasing system ATP-binding protein LolD [bacterium ADurb.Bin212]|nr:MAG: Lipoprotein-releasing system ATP-binding protein LolD [bacterium ADurb.Bin212]
MAFGLEKNNINHEKVIIASEINKSFDLGTRKIAALKNINLEIKSTDFLIIFGHSGCGKSTLLNIISGIDEPTSGKVIVRDEDIFSMSEDNRGQFRSKKMGIIHQMPYWIKSLNVIENVAMPLIIEGVKKHQAVARAKKHMHELKISHLSHQRPTQLSGGEQQKINFARATVSNPWIIIADEPTGNLDSTASDEMMALFSQYNQHQKKTIILVTHNQSYWDMGTRRIEMKDGEVVREVHHG